MTHIQLRFIKDIVNGKEYKAYHNIHGNICFKTDEPNVLYKTLTLRALLKKNLIKINPETNIVEIV